MKNFKKTYYLIIPAVLLIVIGLFSTGMLSNKENWIKLETKKGTLSFTVSATVQATDELNVNSPFSTKIKSVNVIEGQKISKGDILATFDKASFDAQLKQFLAIKQQAQLNFNKISSGNRIEEINSVKANYENANRLLIQKNLEYEKVFKDEIRYKTLYDKKMLTQQEYENYNKDLEIAKNAVDTQKSMVDYALNQLKLSKKGFRKEDIDYAKAEIEKVSAQISDLETNYNKTVVTSPISGTIISKYINSGEEILQGQKMFAITSNANLEIKALIEEEDIDNIKLGDIVLLQADAYPEINFKGRIINIIPSVDPSVKLIPVKVKPESKDLNLISGMTISCTFPGKTLDHLVIKKEAIQYEGKKAFLQTKKGKVYILPGPSFDNLVIIKGNIDKNELVLLK